VGACKRKRITEHMDVKCNRCRLVSTIEAEDFWQGDLEDFADETLVFRFTGYCENVLIHEEDLGKDDEIGDECGQVIEIIRYASLRDHIDVEQN
jgi:hypothetical protein